jgi:putative drug exporter of the RND superfamily
VVRRESSQEGLLESDKRFIDDELKPELDKIANEEAASLQPQHIQSASSVPSAAGDAEPPAELRPISVRTFSDRSIGRLLDSKDRKASLVVLELPSEFLDARNSRLIGKVQHLIDRESDLHPREWVPRGLDLSLSGSATVGRDMMRAATDSSRDTETWTLILVVLLLVAIYRAPLMALIPLCMVAIATEISLALLACLAREGIIGLFAGIEVYVKILCYGAGVDYCLFLIARYKEELDDGANYDEAVVNSLAKVGHALVASAGTVICGIFMMYFAEFGKFHQAGIAITLGLVVVLFAALTFSPALLRLTRHWAFWPRVAGENLSRTAGWVTATSPLSRLFERNWGQWTWNHVSELVRRRPGTVLVGSVFAMLPFAWIGVQFHAHLSYGLLSELPRDTASVIGADAVAQHFPPGIAGPVTVLLRTSSGNFIDEEANLLTEQSRQIVRMLTDELRKQKDWLQLADVRTMLDPYGGGLSSSPTDGAVSQNSEPTIELTGGSKFQRAIEDRLRRERTMRYYVSSQGELKGKVLRVDLVLQEDPFTRNSIKQFETIRHTVQSVVDDHLADDHLEVFALGPTASIRDLKVVTDRDQIRIDILVLLGVYLILIALLRRPTVSLYLIASVFFSYLATLGVTFVVFWAMEPTNSDFAGLDWKVPMFLFTILIAVGEDYNIFLMTRIDEEQALHGPTSGVIAALRKTGSIISSCGVIMAGTFSSLLAGSLVGLHQLGFALAFGVLLDTFVVRPILVPSFLVLLYDGRFSSLSRLFRGSREPRVESTAEITNWMVLGTPDPQPSGNPSNPSTV